LAKNEKDHCTEFITKDQIYEEERNEWHAERSACLMLHSRAVDSSCLKAERSAMGSAFGLLHACSVIRFTSKDRMLSISTPGCSSKHVSSSGSSVCTWYLSGNDMIRICTHACIQTGGFCVVGLWKVAQMQPRSQVLLLQFGIRNGKTA
jgi:hypothetical protein